jgi:hypothetical protein
MTDHDTADALSPPVVRQTIEAWRAQKGDHDGFVVAKAFHGWPRGRELTEAQYDDAVAVARKEVVIR